MLFSVPLNLFLNEAAFVLSFILLESSFFFFFFRASLFDHHDLADYLISVVIIQLVGLVF